MPLLIGKLLDKVPFIALDFLFSRVVQMKIYMHRVVGNITSFQNIVFFKYAIIVKISSKYRLQRVFSRGIYM